MHTEPLQNTTESHHLHPSLFGANFIWGVATAAYQIEGALKKGGRQDSIWDVFSRKNGKIRNGDTADTACDFYHRYDEDLALAHSLGFSHFRFSIAWSRILPEGQGEVNQAGVDFYNRIINKCLALGMTPWITLYHWDLPQALETLGGWKSRRIVDWFTAYATVCAHAFGDRVADWIIINEPMAVAGLGYTTGLHAPGRKGIWNFLPVVHHLVLSQAEGARAVRSVVPDARIGLAISCSHVKPFSDAPADVRAAKRADVLMNRLFVEPAFGMGYPVREFSFLNHIEKYIWPGDRKKMQFDFDFIGLQNYFSVVVRHSYWVPVLWLEEVPAGVRNVPATAMGWAIDPEGLYQILKQFGRYPDIQSILISENGAAFEDKLSGGEVNDAERIDFFQKYLNAVLKAKKEGIPVDGYFAWTLMDNFEWAEGYSARFGLVFVDFDTQVRTVKDSGKWFKDFLAS